MLKALKNIGPGLIVTSAFIGPGTVTLCILSGIEYGYSLLWCIIFSIITTCYLQEISSRIGIISRKGLSEILVDIENNIYNPEYDSIISTGEQYSSALISTFLNKNMITSRSLLGWQIPIHTDKSCGKARILNISSSYIKNLFKLCQK